MGGWRPPPLRRRASRSRARAGRQLASAHAGSLPALGPPRPGRLTVRAPRQLRPAPAGPAAAGAQARQSPGGPLRCDFPCIGWSWEGGGGGLRGGRPGVQLVGRLPAGPPRTRARQGAAACCPGPWGRNLSPTYVIFHAYHPRMGAVAIEGCRSKAGLPGIPGRPAGSHAPARMQLTWTSSAENVRYATFGDSCSVYLLGVASSASPAAQKCRPGL